MIDKNFRIFGKLSIIDVLLAVCVVIFAFLAINFSAPQTVVARPGADRIVYTVELFMLEPRFLDKIHVGATLFDIERGFEIGTIIGVYDLPYKQDVRDFTRNIYRRTAIPGFRYIYIEVEALATRTDFSTRIGHFDLQVGRGVHVRTRDFAAGGFIVMIEDFDDFQRRQAQ